MKMSHTNNNININNNNNNSTPSRNSNLHPPSHPPPPFFNPFYQPCCYFQQPPCCACCYSCQPPLSPYYYGYPFIPQQQQQPPPPYYFYPPNFEQPYLQQSQHPYSFSTPNLLDVNNETAQQIETSDNDFQQKNDDDEQQYEAEDEGEIQFELSKEILEMFAKTEIRRRERKRLKMLQNSAEKKEEKAKSEKIRGPGELPPSKRIFSNTPSFGVIQTPQQPSQLFENNNDNSNDDNSNNNNNNFNENNASVKKKTDINNNNNSVDLSTKRAFSSTTQKSEVLNIPPIPINKMPITSLESLLDTIYERAVSTKDPTLWPAEKLNPS